MDILYVEDNKIIAKDLKPQLQRFGKIHYASDFKGAQDLIRNYSFNAAFIDLYLNGEATGIEIVKLLKDSKTEIFVVSDNEDENIIDEVLTLGANHYYTKNKLGNSINGEIASKLKALSVKKSSEVISEVFCTQHEETIMDLTRAMEIAGNRKININLEGASGTGKTYAAKQFALLFDDGAAPFESININELSDELIESNLFGHKKGSFTGAQKSEKGIFVKANGGTIFLDEIHTLSQRNQIKLLKPIDERMIRPIQGEPINIDIRIITGTNESLMDLVEAKKFRFDLYQRLKGVQIRFYPLRYRKNDIPLLINKFKKSYQKEIRLTQCAWDAFMDYDWPGNIRELNDVFNITVYEAVGKITGDSVRKVIKNRNGFGDNIKGALFDPEVHGKFLIEHGHQRLKEEFMLEMIEYLQKKFHGQKFIQTKVLNLSGIPKNTYKKYKDKLMERYSINRSL